MAKVQRFRMINPTFFVADYLTQEPPAEGCLIYCDPPYSNTTAYAINRGFDHEAFWERNRELEARGHTVIISEYTAPDDFSCVLEIKTITELRMANGQRDLRTERLFRFGEHKPFVLQHSMDLT